MSMIKPRVQSAQILAGTLTREFDMNIGTDYPENVVVFLTISAMGGGEVLDFFGQSPGMSGYADTILTTQVDLKANDEDVIRVMLVATTTGPLDKLKLVAQGVAAAETVDIVVISW